MKIIVLGDVHGEFAKLNRLIEQEKPAIILQVGDFGYWPRLEEQDLLNLNTQQTRIYFCEGNNDDLGALRALVKVPGQPVEVAPGIYYMPRGSVLELTDGRRVLFCGGGQSIDCARRFEGWDWFPEEIVCADDLRLLPKDNIDIVISHTGPSEFPVEESKKQKHAEIDPSREMLSQILRKYQPALWYFGHWHIFAQGRYANTDWVALDWVRCWNNWYRVLPNI